MFTREHLRPGQEDQSGRVLLETADSCFTMVANQIIFLNNFIKKIRIFLGGWSRWVIDDDVSNGKVYIQSKNKGLINIPETSWEIYNGTFHEDNTMRVTG